MGKNDVSWSIYFENGERFADLVNGCGCGGNPVFKASDIKELETKTVYSGRQGEKKSIKYRDVVKKVALGVNFMVIGLENQELVNYGMPLTCMCYDAGEYEKQRRKISAMIRKKRKNENSIENRDFIENTDFEEIQGFIEDENSGENQSFIEDESLGEIQDFEENVNHGKRRPPGEYLYGFGKESRLSPTVTFVLYSGDEWDGPKELTDIIDFRNVPESIKGLVQNYKINLIEIRKWEDTSVFKTDLRQVFDFIRYSKDREKLKDLIENNPEYEQLDEQAYDVIKEYAHVTELKVKAEKGGKVNMCQALQEIIEEEREIARKEEREKMEKEREIARKEEREKMEEERRKMEEERENMSRALQERGEEERKNLIGRGLQNGMSPEQFVSLLGISLEEVLKVQESLLQRTT